MLKRVIQAWLCGFAQRLGAKFIRYVNTASGVAVLTQHFCGRLHFQREFLATGSKVRTAHCLQATTFIWGSVVV